MKKGKLIVVSGFSGAGKGTVMNYLIAHKENYALSVSATTRSPRPGEVEGVSYFYKTTEEFEKMIANHELIEYAQYVEHYYGTPKAFVEKKMEEGKDVLLEIEIQGAMNIKRQFPDAILIFITTPSAKVLRERLIGRGTETADVIEKRLARATKEAEGVENYDYILINEEVAECAEMVDRIVKSAHNRTDENLSIIKEIQDSLKSASEE